MAATRTVPVVRGADMTGEWMTTPFLDVNVDYINKQVVAYNKTYARTRRFFEQRADAGAGPVHFALHRRAVGVQARFAHHLVRLPAHPVGL